MSALFNIMFHSAGNLLLGVFITIVGVSLMFFLVKSWRHGSGFTPQSFIVGVILFFLLSFQTILLCGAITIKSYCDDIEIAVNNMVSGLQADTQFSQQDSQHILEQISMEWPLVGYYVNLADFQGHTPATIGKAMTDELRSYMDWFIIRRMCWCLFFVVAGMFVVLKTMGKDTGKLCTSKKRASSTMRRIYDD